MTRRDETEFLTGFVGFFSSAPYPMNAGTGENNCRASGNALPLGWKTAGGKKKKKKKTKSATN